jgi:hypothetical protein
MVIMRSAVPNPREGSVSLEEAGMAATEEGLETLRADAAAPAIDLAEAARQRRK